MGARHGPTRKAIAGRSATAKGCAMSAPVLVFRNPVKKRSRKGRLSVVALRIAEKAHRLARISPLCAERLEKLIDLMIAMRGLSQRIQDDREAVERQRGRRKGNIGKPVIDIGGDGAAS